MNITNRALFCLLLLSQCMLTASVWSQPRSAIDVATVLTWIERYQAIDAENAELLRQSLDRQAEPEARLELALLEIYSSLANGAEERGLERLSVLVNSLDDRSAEWISPLAQRLLLFLNDQAALIESLQAQADDSAARLERERAAHVETSEKLSALRSIERDLEQREPIRDASNSETETVADDGDG